MTLEEQFEQFWQQFPKGRKQSKAIARRTFEAIVKGKHKDLEATAEQLIAGAMRYAQAMGNNHPYVKMPSTWLNGGCWEDEDLAPPEPQRPASQRHGDLNKKLTDRSWALGSNSHQGQQPAQLPERVSTRSRSIYDDLNNRSWAEK